MKFESVIRKISSWAAAVIIYLVALSLYLGAKGFALGPDNRPVLVKSAQAAVSRDTAAKNLIPTNLVLPQGRSLGKNSAPITIYEFSSLGCSHCADFHLKTLPGINDKYIKTGKVRVVFVDFPIDAKSMQAALAAQCMPPQKYFDFLSLLFKKQREWGLSTNTSKLLTQYASLNGISAERLERCLKDKKTAQEIIDKRQEAINHLHIQGTPTLIIASAKEREVFAGAPGVSELEKILDAKLAQK